VTITGARPLAFVEHTEFDAIQQEISELPADKPEWLERIAELKDMVQQHNQRREQALSGGAQRT
jgi:hypothetical protein